MPPESAWARQCPECLEPFPFESAKEKRRYAQHLEKHLKKSEGVNHDFDVGDYALDSTEPTPSPEANTVRVVDLIDARADEYEIEETGKTVAEHNQYFPNDDPVVVGVYPNMGGDDKRFHFPESRLREV